MQALARRMSPPRRGWYSPLSGQSGCGGTCALKWSTAPFLPAGTQGGEALQVAVPASASAPWAGRRLCDRGPGSGSLFPPQAAAAFAAVLVPDDAQTAAAFRITAIKKQPYAFRKAAPTSGPADRRIPPGTLPRANQQSARLLVPALRCRRPVLVLRACNQNKSPHGGTRRRGFYFGAPFPSKNELSTSSKDTGCPPS